MEQIGILIGTILGAALKTAAPAIHEIFRQCCMIWKDVFNDTVEDGARRLDLRDALAERVRNSHGSGASGGAGTPAG